MKYLSVCGKMRTRIIPNTDTFHAVRPCNWAKKELFLCTFLRSGRLNGKASLSRTRKATKDQKKKFACGLQNRCSEKIENTQGKYLCWGYFSSNALWLYQNGTSPWTSSEDFYGIAILQNSSEQLLIKSIFLVCQVIIF